MIINEIMIHLYICNICMSLYITKTSAYFLYGVDCFVNFMFYLHDTIFV